MKARVLLLLTVFLASSASFAVITFTQLDDDIFVISHRIKLIGSRGRATKIVHEKAASLCVAAGFSYFKILDEDSEAGQQHEAANASVRTQFFFEDAEGRIECERNASAEYVEQAKKKLDKRGYVPMEVPVVGGQAGEQKGPGEAEAAPGTACTVEQITAMAKAGLSAEQIKAACSANAQ